MPLLLCLFPFLDLILRAGAVKVTQPDAFIDPRHDPSNPLKYIASNTLTGIAFSLIVIVGITQTWFIRKWGSKWMMSMTIGAYTFALGLGLRFGLHTNPRAKNLYIIEYMFVVLSPCAFIAADYVLLGRLARHLDADHRLLVSSRKITIVFITSDISTFLIQAIGGALSASANNHSTAIIGSRVFLAGLAAQLLSFFSFWCIYLVFLLRIYRHDPEKWEQDGQKPWYKSWLTLAAALNISCIGILVSVLIAQLEHYLRAWMCPEGRLATSEAFFYGLDTLPLFVAISIYIPFWPGRFIKKNNNDKGTNGVVVEEPKT